MVWVSKNARKQGKAVENENPSERGRRTTAPRNYRRRKLLQLVVHPRSILPIQRYIFASASSRIADPGHQAPCGSPRQEFPRACSRGRTSFGSIQILRVPHLSTLEARRFCNLRLTMVPLHFVVRTRSACESKEGPVGLELPVLTESAANW